MELQHRFSVPASIDVAWEALNDLQSVGSCFPGATVTSVEGDEFTGTCKIKLGPISMQYQGSGKFVERDEATRRAVIEAKGKDKRGNGTAAVTVSASLTAESDERTAVAVDTDLNITGKPAQFGRGVIQDVSDKLLGQFAECLESKIGAPAPAESEAESEAEPSPEPTTGVPPVTGAPPTTGTSPTTASPVTGTQSSDGARRPEPEPEPAALDLGATVLPVLAKRYAPYALGALAVLLVLWRILRR